MDASRTICTWPATATAPLKFSDEQSSIIKNLVKETGALFGSRHYRSYHFLFTLSDHVAQLRPGASRIERRPDRRTRPGRRRSAQGECRSLLPHEFTHSWNGKYRRPAGLATPDYSQPMKGDLLWVYEGLTQYLGEILTPRSGLSDARRISRTTWRCTAAALDRKSGRTWRPLEDTAVAAQLLYFARDDYAEYRRSVDYYDEGTLIWLEADVLIRQLSNGAKSLERFLPRFSRRPGRRARAENRTRSKMSWRV